MALTTLISNFCNELHPVVARFEFGLEVVVVILEFVLLKSKIPLSGTVSFDFSFGVELTNGVGEVGLAVATVGVTLADNIGVAEEVFPFAI